MQILSSRFFLLPFKYHLCHFGFTEDLNYYGVKMSCFFYGLCLWVVVYKDCGKTWPRFLYSFVRNISITSFLRVEVPVLSKPTKFSSSVPHSTSDTSLMSFPASSSSLSFHWLRLLIVLQTLLMSTQNFQD